MKMFVAHTISVLAGVALYVAAAGWHFSERALMASVLDCINRLAREAGRKLN
jgi:hypothetical protein